MKAQAYITLIAFQEDFSLIMHKTLTIPSKIGQEKVNENAINFFQAQ